MPNHAYSVMAAILIATPAYCRIGDSPQQAIVRYGQPTEESSMGAFVLKTYDRSGYTVTLFFRDDVATGVTYTNEGMTTDKVASLLKQNANSHKWEEVDSEEKIWSRSDRKVIAIWKIPMNKLLVFERDAYEEMQRLVKPAEGSQPYTPSRLEWIILSMNAKMLYRNPEKDGFSVDFYPAIPPDPNTVMIVVSYTAKAKPKDIELAIRGSKGFIELLAKSKGWDWLKITTDLVDLDVIESDHNKSRMKEIQNTLTE